MNPAINQLQFWSGRDSDDPYYVLCRLTNLSNGVSIDIVIDWNNKAAKAQFAATADSVIHDTKAPYCITTLSMSWESLI